MGGRGSQYIKKGQLNVLDMLSKSRVKEGKRVEATTDYLHTIQRYRSIDNNYNMIITIVTFIITL